MHRSVDPDPPFVSAAVLRALRDLGDPEAYAAFLRRSHEAWPHRYERLACAIRAGDPRAAMDAVLTLKSASQMIGALKLASAALQLERALGSGHLRLAEALLGELEACGLATMDHLSHEVQQLDARAFGDIEWSRLKGSSAEIQNLQRSGCRIQRTSDLPAPTATEYRHWRCRQCFDGLWTGGGNSTTSS